MTYASAVLIIVLRMNSPEHGDGRTSHNVKRLPASLSGDAPRFERSFNL